MSSTKMPESRVFRARTEFAPEPVHVGVNTAIVRTRATRRPWRTSDGQRHPVTVTHIQPASTEPEPERTDAWGRALMQPGDGHSAWGCNNYDCTDHPQSLYGCAGDR